MNSTESFGGFDPKSPILESNRKVPIAVKIEHIQNMYSFNINVTFLNASTDKGVKISLQSDFIFQKPV